MRSPKQCWHTTCRQASFLCLTTSAVMLASVSWLVQDTPAPELAVHVLSLMCLKSSQRPSVSSSLVHAGHMSLAASCRHFLAGQDAGTVMHCMHDFVQLVVCSWACQQSLKSVGSFCCDRTVRGARSDARVGHRCMLSWQCSTGSLVHTPCRCCQDTPAGLLSCVERAQLCIGRTHC